MAELIDGQATVPENRIALAGDPEFAQLVARFQHVQRFARGESLALLDFERSNWRRGTPFDDDFGGEECDLDDLRSQGFTAPQGGWQILDKLEMPK